MIDLNVKKNASRMGIALILFMFIGEIFVPALMRSICDAAGWEIPDTPAATLLLGTLPMYLVAIPLTWLFIRKMPRRIPNHRSPAPLWFLILLPITLFIMVTGGIIGNGLVEILQDIFPLTIKNFSVDAVNKAPLWLQLTIAVLIGPFFEELLYRKLLMDRLMVYSSRNAILLSAICFGLFHGSLHQIFYTVGMGIILAGLYQNTGNLLFPWALHALANFIAGILPGLVKGAWANTYYTAYILICCLGLVLLVMHRNMLKPNDEPQDLPRDLTTPAMYSNPGMIAYYSVCVLFTILYIVG